MAEHVDWCLGIYENGVRIEDVFRVKPALGVRDRGAKWLQGRLSPRKGVQRLDLRLLYAVPAVFRRSLCRDYRFPDLPSRGSGHRHFRMFYGLSATPPITPVMPVPETVEKGVESQFLAPSVVCMTARASRTS